MRKVILIVAVMFSITCLSLTPATKKMGALIPTGHCDDCASVRDTCDEASYGIYEACLAGGAKEADCYTDKRTWYRMCVASNGCALIID